MQVLRMHYWNDVELPFSSSCLAAAAAAAAVVVVVVVVFHSWICCASVYRLCFPS